MPVISVAKDAAARTITITARFEAPIGRVWQVWSDPRQLERWWGPPAYPATVTEHQLEPGGTVAYAMAGPDGGRHLGFWRVRAVDPPHKLEFEDGFVDADGNPSPDGPTARILVALSEPAGGGTEMIITMTWDSDEAMEQMLATGMDAGVAAAIGQIDELLELPERASTSAQATGIAGLSASPPAGLSFTSALQIRAFRLRRADGDLVVYAAGGWIGLAPVPERQFLGHWHEAAEGGDATGAAVAVHVADADEARKALKIAAIFQAPFSVGSDFQALPMPGHTPGSTAFLWATGDDRVLFPADSIYPRDDGEWRAAVLDTSDRNAMADSLERLARERFTVLAPWVMPTGTDPVVRVAPDDGRERLLAAAARVRAGGA